MAWAPVEQAVQVALFGPLAPVRIDTRPAVMLTMRAGDEERRHPPRPLLEQVLWFSAIQGRPPMPEPMTTPTRGRRSPA